MKLKSKDVNRQKSIEESLEHDVPFEKAVSLTGFGFFHYSIAVVCGLTFLAAGLQNNLNAYIIPSAQCDLSLSSHELGLLNAVFLAGGMASGFLWGVFSDIKGRKKILISGMFVDSIITIFASFSQGFYVLLIFRFLNGFIVGGPAALVLAYLGEFFSEKVRTKVICYVGFFWTLSWVVMPGIAYLVIPIKWAYRSEGFVFNSWRILISLVSIPTMLNALLLSFYPESPRWLLSQGRMEEATNVLATMYNWNTGRPSDEYPVKSLCYEEKKSTSKEENNDGSMWKALSMMIHQGQSLFVLPTLKTTSLTCSIFFANMFGYYGLGLWLPELFNRFESHYERSPNMTVSVCELKAPTSIGTDIYECDSTTIDTKVFTNSLIIGVLCLGGNLLSGILAGNFKRRTIPIFLQISSGLCVIAIYFLTSSVQNLIVSSIFQLCVGTANMVLNALVVDMYPPSVSGMGVCLAILSGRLGAMVSNLVFGHLLDISCSVPIFLVAAVSIGGGFLCALIPNEPYSGGKSAQKVRQAVIT